jgi:flagellar motor switch protein FliM
MNSQFASVTTPNEVVLVTSFDIEFGGIGGAFHVLMPYAMIEPIRELLYSTVQGEHMVTDQRWQRTLSKQVQSADVELTVVLGKARVTLEQVLKMHGGDIIQLDTEDNIVAQVDGVPVMECKYGVSNGQYAVKVEKLLAASVTELIDGGKNA